MNGINKIKELMNLLDELDMDNIDVVNQLSKDFTEWCRWNKSYENIEVFKPKEFRTIVVIHNLWVGYHLSIYNSWDFLKDVKFFLEEYCCENDEDYCYDFWINKLK